MYSRSVIFFIEESLLKIAKFQDDCKFPAAGLNI